MIYHEFLETNFSGWSKLFSTIEKSLLPVYENLIFLKHFMLFQHVTLFVIFNIKHILAHFRTMKGVHLANGWGPMNVPVHPWKVKSTIWTYFGQLKP